MTKRDRWMTTCLIAGLLALGASTTGAHEGVEEGAPTAASTTVGEEGEETVTTVFIVRHAEKSAGADPVLTPEGEARARVLTHVLADAGIDAVFSTDTNRTRSTGQPVAEAAGVTLQTYRDPRDLAETIRQQHPGDQVLLVGHSNTVDDLAAALGASGLSDLDPGWDYDHLYVLHLHGDRTDLERLRYGAPEPAPAADR